MSKATLMKAALASWESTHNGQKAGEAEKVSLCGSCPPIEKMDASLASLKACRHLSLSTNNIEKVTNLAGLDNLEVLSLGRNVIKKLENLEPVSATLQELWISYNVLEKLTGLEKLQNLRVVYCSNNKLRDWAEVDRLKGLSALEELLLAGNPLHTDYKGALADYRIEVLKRLPNLKKLDGAPVESEEREAAIAAVAASIAGGQ